MSRADRSLSLESMSQIVFGSGELEYRANGSVSYSQGKKKRQHGTEAIKSHIVAAKTVANIVKTSLV